MSKQLIRFGPNLPVSDPERRMAAPAIEGRDFGIDLDPGLKPGMPIRLGWFGKRSERRYGRKAARQDEGTEEV